MITPNQVEEIIRLIDKGFDIELLSFELYIPIEQVQKYKEQLELRRFTKESIKNGKLQEAIEQLSDFIKNTENNIVEKMILLKLQSYANKEDINKDSFIQLEEYGKKAGLSKNIDEILDELNIQIPRIKSTNIKKTEKKGINEQKDIKETNKQDFRISEEISKPDYEKVIIKYKEEINNNKISLNKRNLLAFAFFKAGKINEARNELVSLIEQSSNYTAYRQLVHLEKNQGNYEDAKIWAYECLDNYPSSIGIREQLISIAKEENDNKEIMEQLKAIISIEPENIKGKKMLQEFKSIEER